MDHTIFLPISIALFAYCLGSICCAILVCRLMGLADPRTQGSQNPGATNVKRIGGIVPAALTLLGDAFKGWLPTFLAAWFGFSPGWISLIFLMAFIGHLYPVFFKFKGGKGVATAFGGMLALDPIFGLLVIITWLVGFGLSRVSATSALIAATFAPIYSIWLFDVAAYWVLMAILTAALYWTHRDNLSKLFSPE